MFTYTTGTTFIAVLVYVDDILVVGNDFHTIKSLKSQLHATFSIKDLGPLHYYLGIEILRNKDGLALSQRKYTLEPLKLAAVLNSKPAATPLDPNIKLTHNLGETLQDPSHYRTLVGKLLYLTISWQSKKQTVVSRSSIEAEYRGLADSTCEITWLCCLLKDLQVTTNNPIPMMVDNASAIALASNPVQHARTKHIEIDCHFVRDKIKTGHILPKFVPSQSQVLSLLNLKLQTSYQKLFPNFFIINV